MLSSRDRSTLEKTKRECVARGGHSADIHVIPADMTSPEDCARLIQESREALPSGQIDLLVLNAGISMSCPFHLLQDTSFFRDIMEVNYMGPVRCIQHALAPMSENCGTIAVVSSSAAIACPQYRSGYAPSKAAINAFLETLENEIAESVEEKKVRLCTIYPPFVKSNIRVGCVGPSYFEYDEDRMMPVETCVRNMVEGMAQQRRHIFVKRSHELLMYLKPLLPSLVGKIIRRVVRAQIVGTKPKNAPNRPHPAKQD